MTWRQLTDAVSNMTEQGNLLRFEMFAGPVCVLNQPGGAVAIRPTDHVSGGVELGEALAVNFGGSGSTYLISEYGFLSADWLGSDRSALRVEVRGGTTVVLHQVRAP